MSEQSRLLTSAELSEKTDIPSAWLRREAKAGRLPCVRAGHTLRFILADVLRAIKKRQRRYGAKGEPPRLPKNEHLCASCLRRVTTHPSGICGPCYFGSDDSRRYTKDRDRGEVIYSKEGRAAARRSAPGPKDEEEKYS